jgi:hypothetical protein
MMQAALDATTALLTVPLVVVTLAAVVSTPLRPPGVTLVLGLSGVAPVTVAATPLTVTARPA